MTTAEFNCETTVPCAAEGAAPRASEAAAQRAAAPESAPPSLDACLVYIDDVSPPSIDARRLFHELIRRYRTIGRSIESARVTRVVRREGEPDEHSQTQIECRIEDGRIEVVTPASAARSMISGMVGGGRLRVGAAVEETQRRSDLALAPHLGLSLASDGDETMPAATPEGLTPARADRVQVGDRSMVHLELTSGDPESRHAAQMVDLWINADSLLVERVQGRHRLPDGAEVETTLEITPADPLR